MSDASQRMVRLGATDIPDILALLRLVWPQLYGETGCPDFSADYLHWLYEGPDADQHYLNGFRSAQGDLIAFKADLFRRVMLDGKERAAYLASHLAITPDLAFAERMEIAGTLSRLERLEGQPDNLSVAYFEADKSIAKNTRRLARKFGYQVSELEFAQFIVNPRKLAAYNDVAHDVTLTALTLADIRDLAIRMAQEIGVDGPVWTPSPEALAHHLLNAPGSFAIVARSADGALCGALGGYELAWQKSGEISRMFICEMLYADHPGIANALFRKASTHTAKAGLRGIVVENATRLSPEVRAACGMLKTPRQMVFALRGVDLPDGPLRGFNLDIK